MRTRISVRRARVHRDVGHAEAQPVRLREREAPLAHTQPARYVLCAPRMRGVAGLDGAGLPAAGSANAIAQSASASCGAGARSSEAASVSRSKPGNVGRSWLNVDEQLRVAVLAEADGA
jgi:hypothetical protein